MKHLFLSLLLVFSINLPAQAMDLGPQVGETLPSFSLKDQNGDIQSFDSLKGENGLVLAFVRSADWCPYCQRQLKGLNDYFAAFEKEGYPIIAISYDPIEKLHKFTLKNNIQFALLSDEGSQTINKFGILNEEYPEGNFAHGVPRPVIYVVNKDGVVNAVYAEDGYTKRPNPKMILEDIRR